ncbi:hypothetical protein PI124_g16062 [Phytophthora idaei]|nr:hypothetical protein PI124_g16062 [Phytophthora idaei]
MQVVLRETATIPVTTSPEILFQELDLGTEGVGKTSTAVYAFNTRDSSKAFDVACKAILTTCGVWPDHSRVESSTKFNVQYGITKHCYQHNATKAQAWTEARDLYYSRMTGSCGVLVWDFVDADDMYPFKGSTFIKRNTVGALVLRPEVCSDGVERMVCRSICSDMQILVNSPKPSLNVAEFALLEDMMVYKTIKEGATDWHDTVAMEQTDDSSARRKALAMTADETVLTGLTPGLQSSASIGLSFLDVEILVPGEMELQTGALVDEPLQLNACGVVGHCSTSNTMDDLDLNFLSDLLQPDSSSQVEFLPTSNESGESSPTDSPSSDAADTCSSTEEHVRATTGAARSKRAKKTPRDGEHKSPAVPGDCGAGRRLFSSGVFLRTQCEMITLKTEANFLEQQLETLRSEHKQMRANNAVAASEERAIAQRLKRRHAESYDKHYFCRADLCRISGRCSPTRCLAVSN